MNFLFKVGDIVTWRNKIENLPIQKYKVIELVGSSIVEIKDVDDNNNKIFVAVEDMVLDPRLNFENFYNEYFI